MTKICRRPATTKDSSPLPRSGTPLPNSSKIALTVAALALMATPAQAVVFDGLFGRPEATAPFLEDPRNLEAPRPVKINGVKLWIATGNVAQSPEVVREWYQARYHAHGK